MAVRFVFLLSVKTLDSDSEETREEEQWSQPIGFYETTNAN
jgi:hypothetical protein